MYCNRGLSFVELLVGTFIFLIAAIGLTQLFSGTAHKMNFSIHEINCSNLAMQVIDYTHKAINKDEIEALVSDGNDLIDFPLDSLPASDLLSIPEKVNLKYNLGKKERGYLLKLEVHWTDKNPHSIKYGRFFNSEK